MSISTDCYSCVPYDAWSEALCGRRLSDLFHWQRNQYDRLVHLAFGGLCFVPACELARRRGALSAPWTRLFALCFTASLSAVYEVAEWLLTLVVSPAQAQAYNGQPGDFWDAQKDIALALVGSLATLLVQVWRARGSLRPAAGPAGAAGTETRAAASGVKEST